MIAVLRLRWSLVGSIFAAALAVQPALAVEPVDEVVPMVGTGGHGHTYPGATVPFGAVQLSPDTPRKGWDGCAGYHFDDDTILGFSHTHLAGTGIGDLGDVLVMPVVGAMGTAEPYQPMSAERFQSKFSHENEHAEPGYYRVTLDRSGVVAELTTTARVGMHRYTFPAGATDRHLLLDLVRGVNNRTTAGSLHVVSDRLLTGQRTTTGWSKGRTIFFALESQRPWTKIGLELDDKPVAGTLADVNGTKVRAHLDFSGEGPVLIRVGLSYVSEAGAVANLRAEAPTWDFDAVRSAARHQWNDQLSRAKVESNNPAIRQTFYTALYHAMLAPTLFDDADGSYRGPDGSTHAPPGYHSYSTFSLWDTFRAEHPLMTVIEPDRVGDMVRTLLASADQTAGILPMWVLAGRDTGTMIGYHAVPVVYDAYAKGLLHGIDPASVLATMRSTATAAKNGQDEYAKRGYLSTWPKGRTRGAAKTLEFSFDDWCIAQMATSLGKTDDAQLFTQRAQNYRNTFDPTSGFFRGRSPDGTFVPTFDPVAINPEEYAEANTWQYAFAVLQDIPGMIDLYGGTERFTKKLDEFFQQPSMIHQYIPDIAGLIGQYAHGNEPCHHVAYLYALAGQPSKTARLVRQIMQMQYDATPEGICGNDDCGQMSAWYVWSAMGLYPVNPADGRYVIGSPLVSRATITLDPAFYPGKTFTVLAKDVSNQNIYLQSATLNGQPLEHPWITHAELVKGGTLELQMGILPGPTWARP